MNSRGCNSTPEQGFPAPLNEIGRLWTAMMATSNVNRWQLCIVTWTKITRPPPSCTLLTLILETLVSFNFLTGIFIFFIKFYTNEVEFNKKVTLSAVAASLCRSVRGGLRKWCFPCSSLSARCSRWLSRLEGTARPQGALGTPSALHQTHTPPSKHSPNTQALAIKTTPNKHTPYRGREGCVWWGVCVGGQAGECCDRCCSAVSSPPHVYCI